MTKRDHLGNFELMVILVLIRLGENAYGVPISEELEKASGRDIAIASVYARWSASKLKDSSPQRLASIRRNVVDGPNVIFG